ncbi:actin-related protein 2 3 complex subunit 4 [Stylonychia lemnae]|uniref:Actin-related protein 2 3 complex subunit 4 n=1 Tax=Stylonychia lemnae TaxID=5949 RepID=A0A078AV45_STYLE|nr:actin-related protein 2 3 complex subunit 4 [Stylonychia lemnae]|eukprot:CDW84733.1 actin-related protein 2 3 complex subunit 4 [Stylonychia lemnae]
MAQQTLANYLKTIRDTLDATLNLRFFPSELVERQTHPEIEFQDNAKLLMKPLIISKSDQEKCLVEASINSVRVSIAIKKNQDIEVLLTHMLERFLALRADKFYIMRKKPAHENYDFSFLITDEHLMKFKKEELINFILEFIQGIDKEINDMKLAIINQTRIAAAFFTNALANNPI